MVVVVVGMIVWIVDGGVVVVVAVVENGGLDDCRMGLAWLSPSCDWGVIDGERLAMEGEMNRPSPDTEASINSLATFV